MSEIKLPVSASCKKLTIEVVKIERNKIYDCMSYGDGDCHNEMCDNKKDFMLHPKAHKPLCATEVEFIITNLSSTASHSYSYHRFQLVDTEGFTYNGEQQCSYLRFGRYEYFQCDINPNSRIRAIVCFPELEETNEVHKIYYEYDYDGTKIELNIAPLSQTAQQKLDSINEEIEYYQKLQARQEKISQIKSKLAEQEKQKAELEEESKRLTHGIERLESAIFQRLNNILTKSERISLENQVMNIENGIRLRLKSLGSAAFEKFESQLNEIMEDYHKRLIPANGNKTEVWERISNEGVRDDLGETVFRSSWEANIARILNSKGIHWEYETTPFMLDATPYLPDFFLNDGTIMEIKGHWDNESITKVEAFMRSNPETNYLIVDHDMYPDLTQMYADKIPNWEKVQAEKEKVNVVIVGLAFVPDKSVVKGLQVGDALRMELEPNNQYDKFAIAVKDANGGMVGHIEKKFAPIYAQKLKLGMTFSLDIISIEPKIIRAKAYRNNWGKPIVHSILNSEA